LSGAQSISVAFKIRTVFNFQRKGKLLQVSILILTRSGMAKSRKLFKCGAARDPISWKSNFTLAGEVGAHQEAGIEAISMLNYTWKLLFFL